MCFLVEKENEWERDKMWLNYFKHSEETVKEVIHHKMLLFAIRADLDYQNQIKSK